MTPFTQVREGGHGTARIFEGFTQVREARVAFCIVFPKEIDATRPWPSRTCVNTTPGGVAFTHLREGPWAPPATPPPPGTTSWWRQPAFGPALGRQDDYFNTKIVICNNMQ